MHAGFRACAAVFAALATLTTAGCTLSNAAADGPKPTPAATRSATPLHPTPHHHVVRSLPPGTRQLTVHGRRFLLFVPHGVRRPAPLVVALGGIGSTEQTEVATFKLTGPASRSGAVVAYPDPVDRTWNAGGCCWGAKADDVGFLTRMRSTIARLITLDPRRQVLLGYSNGGMLAYDAACADVHWTAVVVLGASLTTRCNPNHPFDITNVNGALDNVAPWAGGWSTYTRTVMPPVWKIDAEFAAAFRCGPARRTTSHGDPIYTYVRCRGGVFVRDIQVPGLTHHWSNRKQDGFDMGPVLWRLTGV